MADLNPSSCQLTLYIEYLSQHLKSPQSVKNYLAAVNRLHRQMGLECPALQSYQVQNMLRAVNNTLRTPIVSKLPVSIQLLYKLVHCCNQLGTWGLVVQVALLFCFFGFLRQSNVAPRSPQLFDVTRDTLRADVQHAPPGLLLKLRWTKTHQGAHQPVFIPLPNIQGSILCPTRAFRRMCAAFPSSSPTTPLLIYSPAGLPPTVVTTRMLARQLNQLLLRLHLPPQRYTLHSLRKGGATLCHAVGVPLDQIKSHGTWVSDSVWTYINPAHSAQSAIPAAMSRAVTANIVHN